MRWQPYTEIYLVILLYSSKPYFLFFFSIKLRTLVLCFSTTVLKTTAKPLQPLNNQDHTWKRKVLVGDTKLVETSEMSKNIY